MNSKEAERYEFPLFYCCYLLRSQAPRYTKHTYVGSTPNPIRRLRQHNGEISAGAWKTNKKRPCRISGMEYG
ncbi:Structure-specific endonuclease subunit SLX1 [Zancudomyces culisetae]|uniref:Structure-specific endonuclease subunit SLX1 n=1 Tax=Zancudomyces culisetae TaxID=1213189 RepID=A0A1R1PQQ9_ZANCU|nr:Structure-specific endonuclease subunit SLX1 [Zancudomyces culisetae]|eukprot:OMH83243.1 Structure-specific endonuclease subunit SLX1 [Zancudomyces culisetae]